MRHISKQHRALTIVELVVSLLLLFIASTFLMGMFLSASGAPARLEKASKLDQMASLKMDEIIAADLGYVPPGGEGTIPEFPDYTYTINTQEWDEYFFVVTVLATAPDGQSRSLTALKPKMAPEPPPPPPTEEIFPDPSEEDPGDEPEEGEEPWIPEQLPPPPTVADPGFCLGCHNTNPEYYPDWTRDSIIASAIASGKASDEDDLEGAVNYVRQSIFNPSAFIVPGYGIASEDPDDPQFSPMNSNFSETISSAEAEQIANWLLSEGTNYDAPTPPPRPSPPSD